jgi:hypothetical protein
MVTSVPGTLAPGVYGATDGVKRWHLTLFELCSSTGSLRMGFLRRAHYTRTRKDDPSLTLYTAAAQTMPPVANPRSLCGKRVQGSRASQQLRRDE